MIVDTIALLAFFNSVEPLHYAVALVLTGSGSEPLVVSPYVLAELDYLISTRVGVAAELSVLPELAGGAWELAAFGSGDVVAATAVIDRYSDKDIGLADASNVVLARRYDTRTVATLDRRHFSTLRPLNGGQFTILP